MGSSLQSRRPPLSELLPPAFIHGARKHRPTLSGAISIPLRPLDSSVRPTDITRCAALSGDSARIQATGNIRRISSTGSTSRGRRDRGRRDRQATGLELLLFGDIMLDCRPSEPSIPPNSWSTRSSALRDSQFRLRGRITRTLPGPQVGRCGSPAVSSPRSIDAGAIKPARRSLGDPMRPCLCSSLEFRLHTAGLRISPCRHAGDTSPWALRTNYFSGPA